MFNKCIVTGLAGMLLFGIRFSAIAAPAGIPPQGPVAAEQVLLLVETAAKQHMARLAESSAMAEAKSEVSVVRGSRPLAACRQGVTVEAVDTRLPSRMRFAAVCAAGGADSWRYEFVVRAQLTARVAVIAADVPLGKILTEDDLLLERHDISSITDSIADVQEVLGMSGRRALRSGEVVRLAMLTAPTVVKRGDAVRIVARREQIEVSMAGEALDSGARGALVRVRNANGATIRARVTGAATVEPADMALSTSPPNE